MSDRRQYLIRAEEIPSLAEFAFRHPLNPASEVHMRSLGDLAGLERLGLHVARVPPGKESFAYHFHHVQEEFVYILSGRGVADIGEESYEVGPGDVMVFPAPSPGHHLRNPFDTELVYLMGGQRTAFEVGEFPRLRKKGVWDASGGYVVDMEAVRPFAPRDDGDERG